MISFGDFLYSNKALPLQDTLKNGGSKMLKELLLKNSVQTIQKAAEETQISLSRLNSFLADPFSNKPTFKEAILLSLNLGVPLHPSYLFFWSSLSDVQEVELLKTWLQSCEVTLRDGVVCKISGVTTEDAVKLLRRILAPHRFVDGKILLEGETAAALALCSW